MMDQILAIAIFEINGEKETFAVVARLGSKKGNSFRGYVLRCCRYYDARQGLR